jgi:hypothetical protein
MTMTMTTPDQEITWAEVVESDQIYSAKTGRYYPVISSVRLKTGKMRVMASGLPKPVEMPLDAKVTVTRGPTGQAVDLLNTTLWSGPNRIESEES